MDDPKLMFEYTCKGTPDQFMDLVDHLGNISPFQRPDYVPYVSRKPRRRMPGVVIEHKDESDEVILRTIIMELAVIGVPGGCLIFPDKAIRVVETGGGNTNVVAPTDDDISKVMSVWQDLLDQLIKRDLIMQDEKRVVHSEHFHCSTHRFREIARYMRSTANTEQGELLLTDSGVSLWWPKMWRARTRAIVRLRPTGEECIAEVDLVEGEWSKLAPVWVGLSSKVHELEPPKKGTEVRQSSDLPSISESKRTDSVETYTERKPRLASRQRATLVKWMVEEKRKMGITEALNAIHLKHDTYRAVADRRLFLTHDELATFLNGKTTEEVWNQEVNKHAS